MPQDHSTYDDEVDLFGLFETLLDGKRVISAFVAIAVLFASSFIYFKDPVYESEISYSINTLPPFYNKEKALGDFKKKFYSKSVFEDWKKSKGDISLTYEDFTDTEIIDGFLLTKESDEQLATLVTGKKDKTFIKIKSNELSILNYFFEYASKISEELENEYVSRAKDELIIIETRFKDFSSAQDVVIEQILATDRFIEAIEKGAKIINLKSPQKPIKKSPKPQLIFPLAVILGVMVGFFFIILRKTIRDRKEKLTKA